MANVHFDLVTPERRILSEEAFMVVVPGTEGDFGVLAGHAPFMTTVRDGEIAVHSSMTAITKRIRVVGGFAEVTPEGLTVLAERADVVA